MQQQSNFTHWAANSGGAFEKVVNYAAESARNGPSNGEWDVHNTKGVEEDGRVGTVPLWEWSWC